MGKHQGLTPLEERLHRLFVQLALGHVRHQHHDDVGLLGDLVRGGHLDTLRLDPGPTLAAGVEPDHNVDAAVAKVQGMGVSLASETEDAHSLALQPAGVSVFLVVDGSHQVPPARYSPLGLFVCAVLVLTR